METTKQVLPDMAARVGDALNHDERDEKKVRKARRNSTQAKAGNGARYFLAAERSGKNDDPPVLGEEFPNEDEVLVASHRRDTAFYRVETWKAHAEKKGRNMVLRKQS
jgi:hypothetical protein